MITLGALPIGLHAEHGLASRSTDGLWRDDAAHPGPWLDHAVQVLASVARKTPGALVEVKTCSVAFHFRRTEPSLAAVRLREARELLAPVLVSGDAELLEGHAVLEVRRRGVHKGLVARALAAPYEAGQIVAAGDDRTDEDMFAALPDGALTLRVGRGASTARYRVADPSVLRHILRTLTGVATPA